MQEDSTHQAATLIQKVFRGFRTRRQLKHLSHSVITLQALFRGKRVRKQFKSREEESLREEKRAKRALQKCQNTAQYKFSELKLISQLSAHRVQDYYQKLHHSSAVSIQSWWRGVLAKKERHLMEIKKKEVFEEAKKECEREKLVLMSYMELTEQKRMAVQEEILDKLEKSRLLWKRPFREYQNLGASPTHSFAKECHRVTSELKVAWNDFQKTNPETLQGRLMVVREILKSRNDLEKSLRLLQDMESIPLSQVDEAILKSLAKNSEYDEETSKLARIQHLKNISVSKRPWWELLDEGVPLKDIHFELHPPVPSFLKKHQQTTSS